MIEENKSSMKNSVRRIIIAGILGGGAVNAFKRVFTNYYIINSSN